MTFLVVFLGAGIGGAARHAVNLAALRLLGPGGVPFGTLLINVLGSFAMGVVVAAFAARSAGDELGLRLFLTTGILGGFTTFSAFSLEATLLWERGATAAFAGYVVGSVALSLAGLGAGLALVRGLMA